MNGSVKQLQKEKSEICYDSDAEDGIMILMPSHLNWFKSRDLCRRFGGKLHIDKTEKSVEEKSSKLVANGEKLKPGRCGRVWLGATDLQEEGVWRESESGEILKIDDFWAPGQPNGEKLQNCLGIYELVRKISHLVCLENEFLRIFLEKYSML